MAHKGSDRSSVAVFLFHKLKRENALWSYDNSDIHACDIPDSQLIAMTMRYLDLQDINLLFKVFPFKKIKESWREILVPEGEYLYTLNRFFAWFYFKAKRPDSYLKSLMTRRSNLIMQ